MTRRPLAEMSKEDLIREIEKLEVHQVELEIQNHELLDAQQRLEEAAEHHAALHDFAPVGYCTLDPAGRIREANLSAAALLGAPRGDLVGRLLTSFLPLDSRRACSEHLARCRTESTRMISELVLAPGPEGARTVQLISEPILDHDGQASAFRTNLVDISARKQLERDLRLLAQAGQELGATMDRARTLDTAARLVVPAVADLCMIDMVGEAGTVERPVVMLADPDHALLCERLRELAPRPGRHGAQAQVIASGEPILLPELSEEVRRHTAYDDRHAEALRAAGIQSAMIVPLVIRGRVLGALTLGAGASGRRYTMAHLALAHGLASRIALALDNARLYADAQRATAARDATLALVSHDLRTPLGVILMRTQLLQQSAPAASPREDQRSVEVIRYAAARMGRLIQDLVDIASIEAGRVSVARSRQPVASLVEEAVEALRAHAAAKSLRLEAELPAGDRMEADCDRDRIAQVLTNLIGNAIKFTPAGGRILVRAEPFDAEVQVSVADSGPGIAPADLPHVFDRYWQARDTAHLGSGLGLAIAKGIVEAHGGRIWAESQPGAGTTLRFTLPRAAEPRAPAARPANREARQDGTVLVVDDDPDARDALCEVLAHGGYGVATAANGAEALAYLRRGPTPMLILLDLAMPVMDGWAFLTEREGDPDLRALPVLVMSGQRDVADQVAALHAGYLVKTAPMDRLLDEVARAAH